MQPDVPNQAPESLEPEPDAILWLGHFLPRYGLEELKNDNLLVPEVLLGKHADRGRSGKNDLHGLVKTR